MDNSGRKWPQSHEYTFRGNQYNILHYFPLGSIGHGTCALACYDHSNFDDYNLINEALKLYCNVDGFSDLTPTEFLDKVLKEN